MNNREEFEKWYIEMFCISMFEGTRQLKKNKADNYTDWGILKIFKAWQEASARKQKIIELLENRIESIEDDKKIFIDECNRLRKEKLNLKALNPDVPCPAGCDGSGYITSGIGPVVCTFCSRKGTVSTVKALQYEIEQLKKVNK